MKKGILAFALAITVSLGIAIWWFVSQTAGEPSPVRLAEAASQPPSKAFPPAPATAASIDEDATPPDPGAPESLEDSADKSSYLDRHRASLASEDWDEAEEAFRNLVRHIEEHPENFAEIAFALRSDPDLIRNLDVFAAAPLAAFAAAPAFEAEFELKAKLLTGPALVLATEHEDPEIRAIGLSVLGRFPVEDAAVVELAARTAREGTRSEIESGVAALASWVYQDSPLREQIADELARTTATLDCEELWPRAVQSIVLAHGNIPDPLATALTDYLDGDPSSHRHSLVARTLRDAGEAYVPFAVELFGIAFLEESDAVAQRMILRELMETGEADTVAWAQEVSLKDETLTPATREYMELIQSGVTDFEEIQNLTSRRQSDLALQPDERNEEPE